MVTLSERPRLCAPKRIAVFRALQLGDMLCVVPALRALRSAYPEARITLVGMPWASSFVARFAHYIDDLLVFPGFPGFPEQPANLAAVPAFLAEAQSRAFDLALQMHGSGSASNAVMALFGATYNAGYTQPGHYCPDPSLFLPWEESEHEVVRYVRLVQSLGLPAQGTHLEFPLHQDDFAVLQALPGVPPGGTYACIHPGARLPSRRWLPQRFAAVADRLVQAGVPVVLTGSDDESELVRRVQSAMRTGALDVSGKTTLGALAALIADARLVVSNDTGISHVAAGLGTPSLIVASGSDVERWSPLDKVRHRVLSAAMACRPCMHVVCPTAHECAAAVSAEEVATVALEMAGREPGRARAGDARSAIQLPRGVSQ
jgi:ADP-heptose:LPS heptosyltransferase